MIPARMCLESLDRRPGIREQPGSKAVLGAFLSDVRFTPTNRHRRARGRMGPSSAGTGLTRLWRREFSN